MTKIPYLKKIVFGQKPICLTVFGLPGFMFLDAFVCLCVSLCVMSIGLKDIER